MTTNINTNTVSIRNAAGMTQNPFSQSFTGTGLATTPSPDVSGLTEKDASGIDAFVQDILNAGLSDAVIATLLAQVLVVANKNRQQERLVALQQANISLALAKSSAQNQIAAAKKTATGEIIAGGMGITSGAIEGVANAISLGRTMNNNKLVDREANQLYPKDERTRGVAAKANAGPNAAPPSYDEIMSADFDEKSRMAKKLSEADAEADARRTNNAPAMADENELARKEYKANRERTFMHKEDAKLRLVQAVTTILQSIGKITNGVMTSQAGFLNAQATVERALAEYMNQRSSNSNEYASEAGQIVQAALQAINSVENSRHKALGGIWA